MHARRVGPAASHIPSTSFVDRRRFVVWMGGVAILSACGRRPEGLTGPPEGVVRAGELLTTLVAQNVRDSGAQGDGVTDDTSAFERAITALGTKGGVLQVPGGIYLINPLRSIRLGDNTTLQLAPDAVLKAIPVTYHRYGVVHIENARNVCVSGGTIIGEREGHLGVGGEGGMGIRIWGSYNVRIENVQIRDCWGDGIYVGSTGIYNAQSVLRPSYDVTISNCISRNNRRQGLSIVGCVGALVEDSEFSDTNGTAPESGIDLEPNTNCTVTDITIRNCVALRNAGYGILMCGNDIYNGTLKRVLVENNQCADNALAGSFVLRGASECRLIGNVLERNQNQGLMFEQTNYNELTDNTLRDNSLAQPGLYPHVLLTGGSSHNSVLGNSFASEKRLPPLPVLDIVVTPDCIDNVVQAVA